MNIYFVNPLIIWILQQEICIPEQAQLETI